MSSTTNGMCGIEGFQLAERAVIQPFQGWGVGMTHTQGFTLGCGIQPLRGLRAKTRRNPENGRMAAYQGRSSGRRRRRSSAGRSAAYINGMEVSNGFRNS